MSKGVIIRLDWTWLHPGLSMLEQEKRWALIQQGRADEYHGVAVHPRHLSLFEKYILKRHHQYQPLAETEVLPRHDAHNNDATVNGFSQDAGVSNDSQTESVEGLGHSR